MPDLSVQLYTLRKALAEDFDGTLAALAETGFSQVEPYGLVAHADRLTAMTAYGLSAPTAHAHLLGANLVDTFAAAVRLGVGTVIEPMVDPARWEHAEDIAVIATELNAAAEVAADLGLQVGYHNHHFELASMIEGRHALEVFADHLLPDVVLEVDTYWAYAGGADVPALLTRLGGRVFALHVKDGDGTLDKTRQVAVGSGSLPIWDILAAAPETALRVVELDDSTGDLLTAVRNSRAFLNSGPPAGSHAR